MDNKNAQILSIEGKDVLTKRYIVNKNSIYKGSLDDSMEIDELNKLSKKIIKINKAKDRFYSNDIITITFKYACKADKDLTDEEYERVESLKKALELITDIEDIKYTKKLIAMAERKINKKQIRRQLYRYGFNIMIDGKLKHFVRYKRSSGSARVGKCLFINDEYYKHMIDWSFAGIEHEEDTEMDCASMESYISLPTSSCIGRIKIRPENILLIDDGQSTFKDTVMATRLINEVKDKSGNIISGDLDTNIEETEITNKIWDGSSLLDKSLFDENGYEDKAVLQIRNRMFKGIGVNTDIQQFFKDNNITDIKQLNGKTVAKNISQIKLITTPSSVKYLKYGTFEKWLKYIVEDWGVCKYEKPQRHFNGMVQTHYQLLNTLGMSYKEMKYFLNDTIDYIKQLKKDTGVFKYHLGLKNEEDSNVLSYGISSSSDFILNVLNINDDFINTKICKKFRNEIIYNYIKNVRRGHVLVEGNYSVVVSCPYEYLLASIGKWDKSSLIKPHECVSSKFKVGEEILGVRSPQPTMCNMTVFKNGRYNELDRYFNTKSKEVIYISAIGWNVFELESSMDVDGDQMAITNNKWIVENAKKLQEKININGQNVNRFLVSTDFTPKMGIKRKYNWEDLADTDIKCSSNKIGEIINLAQQLNSIYWEWKHQGKSEEKLFELYKDICQLNILSCIEIDRCKKLSPVDATKELKKIRDKGYIKKGKIIRNKQKKEVSIRPYFFKFLEGGRNYQFKKMNTGMDYLNIVLDELIDRDVNYENTINILDIIKKHKANKADRRKVNKIKKIAKELKCEQSKIWDSDVDNKWELNQDIYKECLRKIKSIEITKDIIYTLFLRINKSYTNEKFVEYRSLGLRILKLLYDSDKVKFLDCIDIQLKNNENLIEDKEGNIDLYGVKFTKIGQKCTT